MDNGGMSYNDSLYYVNRAQENIKEKLEKRIEELEKENEMLKEKIKNKDYKRFEIRKIASELLNKTYE